MFGDRIDHNGVISTTNTNLLLNLVSIAVGPVFNIPTLSPLAFALAALLLAALGVSALNRRQPLDRRA